MKPGSGFAAALIFVSLTTGALADELKLETQSYLIRRGMLASNFMCVISIRRGSRILQLIRHFFSSMAQPIPQRRPSTYRSAVAP